MVDREIFVSAEESDRGRIDGIVEDPRTKVEAQRSDRTPKDFFTGRRAGGDS